jgi:hypothetical protein
VAVLNIVPGEDELDDETAVLLFFDELHAGAASSAAPRGISTLTQRGNRR